MEEVTKTVLKASKLLKEQAGGLPYIVQIVGVGTPISQ
ncbi:hypothetical protein CLV24_11941 [Pontibacter ummariensis]|uniref:Uncharacterized protein n=1 Tax=Pontibacter ummariensis TaxID=1610492 RepID=A0A239IXQ0_9BACT|nr:hypothetical protein CLV24_11941 [Pontibacter ummariensis]SNS97803.1 hypothetical protein SAMN06296052_11941 [Pontibacter ummariensis]